VCAISSSLPYWKVFPDQPGPSLLIVNSVVLFPFPNPVVISSKNIYIGDNVELHITQDITFTSCYIRMGVNSKIVVDANKMLTLTMPAVGGPGTSNHPTHLFCCNGLWEGIVVNNGGTLIANRSTKIQDAHRAVVLPPGSTSSFDRVVFNANVESIRMLGNSSVTPINFTFGRSLISCRYIPNAVLTQNLVDPNIQTAPAHQVLDIIPTYVTTVCNPPNNQKSIVGIRVSSIKYELWPVGSAYPTIGIVGAGKLNYFDNLQIGIYAESTDIDIHNNQFMNMSNTTGNVPLLNNILQGTAIGAVTGQAFDVIKVSNVPNARNLFLEVSKSIHTDSYCNIEISRTYTYNSPHFFTTGTIAPRGEDGFFLNKIGAGLTATGTFTNVKITGNYIRDCTYGITLNYTNNRIAQSIVECNFIFSNPGHQMVRGIELNGSAIGAPFSATTLMKINENQVGLDMAQPNFVSTNCYAENGIRVISNSTKLHVFQNQIMLNSLVIGSLTYGIYAANCSPEISTFGNYLRQFATSNKRKNGIYLISCFNQKTFCNTTYLFGSHLTFDGMNIGSISSNTMNSGIYGLIIQNNGRIGTQGNTTTPVNLRWIGPWATLLPSTSGATKAWTMSGSNNMFFSNVNINSRLFLRNLANQFPPVANNYQLSSIPVPGNNPPEYSATGLAPGPGLNIASGAPSVICITNNNNCVPIDCQGDPWNPNPFCHQIPPPSPLNSTEDFIQLKAFPVIVKDSTIKELVNDTMNTDLNARNQGVNISYNNVADSIEAGVIVNDADLMNHYTNNQGKHVAELRKYRKEMMLSNYGNAGSIAGALPSANNVEQNHKDFAVNYLTAVQDSFKQNTVYANSVLQTSNLCYVSDGNAVFEARALIANLQGAHFDWADSCSINNARMYRSDEQNAFYADQINTTVYPNPTAGIFTFVIEDNADNTYAGKIEITDIQGKIIKSSVVETQNSLLDITDLEAGIYFYKFYPSNSSKISIGKILKQ